MNGALGIFLGLSVLMGNARKEIGYRERFQLNRYASDKERVWVDSVFNALTPTQRAAQLLMVPAYSNKTEKAYTETEQLVERLQPGGVIFFQGNPLQQAKLTNRYQARSRVPMLVAGDYEWGLSMRLDSAMRFPWQMTLGAVENTELIRRLGLEMARQCRRIGVNVSFSPVLDVNNNPANPIIGARSFGEDKHNVVQKAIALTAGLQEGGVLASGKHFPGHGDTDKDSHKDLPLIPFSRQRLDSLELFPFKALADAGIGSMMVAHLSVPALDSTPNLPSSLSRRIVNEKLRVEMGYNGLVFTDAMNMKGVADRFPSGEASVRALEAGADVLLMPEDPEVVLAKVLEAVQSNRLSSEEMEQKVKRVLRCKYRLGLTRPQTVKTEGIYEDLFTTDAEYLNRSLYENAMTLIKNENEILPLQNLETQKIALVRLGGEKDEAFHSTLQLYFPMVAFDMPEDRDTKKDAEFVRSLKDYTTVIVSVHKSDKNPWKNYKIYAGDWELVKSISEQNNTVLTVFANAYSLHALPEQNKLRSVVMAYQNNAYAQSMAAQLIFGGIQSRGHLPVSISERWKAGFGLDSRMPIRMKYTMPEEFGVTSARLKKADEIALEGIAAGAYPGCQILAAKNGKVIYYKSFGHHTYKKERPVINSDIYDLASVTKVTSTLGAVMKMYDEGALDLKQTFGHYIPYVKGTNKENIRVEDILTHQAGLKAWIPFYLQTMEANKKLLPALYSRTPVPGKTRQVADSMYILDTYRDSMYIKMYASPLGARGSYVYSDLGFYFMQAIVERWKEEPLDQMVQQMFYKSLGAYSLGFKPLERFPRDRIVPTEQENYWRRQLIHGYVHDQGAAMCGGVAGHAGLFSNANDLAKMMQMYLNKGSYGGVRYLSAKTVEEFSKCRFCANGNRRALGFDRAPNSGGTPCECVSYNSYGHTGFTGTMVWMDPETGILYVFLSNRVHPDAENKLLMNKNIRARIQEVFYSALQ